MDISLPLGKALLITTLYEMCYINKLAYILFYTSFIFIYLKQSTQ